MLAYDSARAVTVLYGGILPGTLGGPDPGPNDVYNDTWEFDGSTWARRFPANVPFRLQSAAMSYDPVKRVTIMFGGIIGTNGFPTSGFLWEWDGQDWKDVPSVGEHPRPRYRHKMVYDSARHVHVLFGGGVFNPNVGYETPVTETWEYDAIGRTWALRTTNGPTARWDYDLAYDPIRQRTVLFGGELINAPTLADGYANDTWVWDGAAGIWQQVNPPTRPSGRYGHAMTFDSTRGAVVLLGGRYVKDNYTNSVVPANSAETWEWNGANWTRPPVYAFCCGIVFHTMVYETARQQVLFFANTGGTIHDPMLTWAAGTGNGRGINYVDSGNFTFLEDGSEFFPYRSVRTAIGCTLGAGTISIQAGYYAEGPLRITKQLTLESRNGPAFFY